MYLNTSFKFRKNHLYKLKAYAIGQSQHCSQTKKVDCLTFISTRPGIVKTGEYAALRRILGRKTEKLFRLTLIRKPDLMVTAKPREMRMGKGKGAFSHVHLPVRAGMPVIKLTWCHRLPRFSFLAYVRAATKKASTQLYF